jgi:NNP family nitrate/nitrite transporter-like MFS transporter
VWQSVSEKGRWRGEVWDTRKNGEPYRELLSVTAVRDDSGQVVHYCAIMMDVTSAKPLRRSCSGSTRSWKIASQRARVS